MYYFKSFVCLSVVAYCEQPRNTHMTNHSAYVCHKEHAPPLISHGSGFRPQGYTQVYLPFYSDMAKDRRQRVRDGTLGDGRQGGAGSMWDNIDGAAKGKRGAGVGDGRSDESKQSKP